MLDPQTQSTAPVPTRRNSVRAVALSAAALFLVASSYQASFARSRTGQPISHIDQYGGGGGGGNNDSGLSSGETAAIAVGGVAAVGAAYYFTRKKKEDEEKSPESGGQVKNKTDVLPALPDGVRAFSGVRLTPGESELVAGGTRIFDLQVRSKADGKWYSVTGRAEAQIALKGSSPAVVPVDGVKNTFCVPISAPRSADGKTVRVVGTFSPKGLAPLSAEAQLRVRVQPEAPALSSSAF